MVDFKTARNRRRICVVGASFNTGNLGVSALATGTVSAVVHAFPDAEVLFVDYAKEPSTRKVRTVTGEVIVETMNIRFSKKAYLPNNIALLILLAILARLIPFSNLSRRIIESNEYLKRMADADLVLSLAGGDSFSDIYGFGRLLYVALPQVLALCLNRPLIVLPQTLGPFKGRWAKSIARGLLNRAAVIYSRDRRSIEEANRELGIPQERVRFAYDMAFAMEPVEPKGMHPIFEGSNRAGQTLVGLNISGLLMIGGYTKSNMFGLACDYPELIRRLVAEFLVEDDVKIVLVPHVFGGGEESDVETSARFHAQLTPEERERVILLGEQYDQQEIKFLIGQCDFFVGARMHACIAAISQCVPAVCLAYSRKFIGVMEGIQQSQLVVDLQAVDAVSGTQSVMELFRSRDSLRLKIREVMPGVISSVQGMLKSTECSGFPDQSGSVVVAAKLQ